MSEEATLGNYCDVCGQDGDEHLHRVEVCRLCHDAERYGREQAFQIGCIVGAAIVAWGCALQGWREKREKYCPWYDPGCLGCDYR